MKSPQLQKTKGYFAMAASEIKTMPQSVRKYPSNIPSHIETSQSTCFENQFTGFHTAQASTKDISKQTLMGHSKVQKIKKRKLLVKPESYSELHQRPRQKFCLKTFFIKILKIKSQYMQLKLVKIYIYIYINV